MTRQRPWSALARYAGIAWAGALALAVATLAPAGPVAAQDAAKPNILFIMGDDIGYMQPSIYHRGLMVGETPNIDRLGLEGALFTYYDAEAELHRRAERLFHRHAPVAHRHDPAPAAWQPELPPARTPAIAWFLRDLGYNTGEFGKNHLGDHNRRPADRARLPRVLGGISITSTRCRE